MYKICYRCKENKFLIEKVLEKINQTLSMSLNKNKKVFLLYCILGMTMTMKLKQISLVK